MAGAGAIIGSIAQPIAAHFAQKRQHKYVKKYMKNKYQWEVADLIAAGLNPILGYTKGGPPIGSVGIPSIAGGQGATAISAMKLAEELRLLRQTADRTEAEVARTKAQTKKVDLEVEEFPIRGGVARRVFNKANAEKFLNAVGRSTKVPQWVRQQVMNAAERVPAGMKKLRDAY